MRGCAWIPGLLIVLLLPVSAWAIPGADQDGCFQPRPNCVEGRGEWGRSVGVQNPTYTLYLTNRCQGRVTVSAGILGENGRKRSESLSIPRGETRSIYHLSPAARPRTSWSYTGSTQSMNDWRCRNRSNM